MMTNKEQAEFLYDYLFHYNPYEDLWYAFTREHHLSYFNKGKKSFMQNKNLDDLVKSILTKHKTNGTEKV